MMRLFLCVAKWRKAQHTWAYVSIYVTSKVQKELIRTIFFIIFAKNIEEYKNRYSNVFGK